MAKCKKCKNNYKTSDCEPRCNMMCENYSEFEPITNADRIRSMTDEELAEFLKETIRENGDNLFLCEEYADTKHCMGLPCAECKAYLAWLKTEVGCE